jgi:hypothetical protein
VRGQLGRTFVTYATEHLQLWRPGRYDPSQTAATEFHITAAGQDAFARAVPLHSPRLETNEEFIVNESQAPSGDRREPGTAGSRDRAVPG